MQQTAQSASVTTPERRTSDAHHVVIASLPIDWVGRIKWTTLVRVIALSGLLIFGIAMDLGMGPQGVTQVPEVILYQVVTAFFILSFVALLGTYLLANKYAPPLAWSTMAVDVLLAGAMVAISHGTDSVFLFAMPLAVLSGAALLERRGAFVAATACALILCLVAVIDLGVLDFDMEPYTAGWLRSLGPRAPPQAFSVLVSIVVQIGALYGTALLSSKFVKELARARAAEQAERRELAVLRVRYEDVVSSLPDGLATLSNNGIISSCNPAFAQILGSHRDALVGRQLRDMLPELERPMTASTTLEIRRESLQSPEEITRERANGEQIIAVKTAYLRGPEGVAGSILILRDVTAVRRREDEHRARERLAAVGEMAMAVAHEIRNPLASISGTVQLLEAAVPDDEGSKALMEIAVRETKHLSSWIGDFLDFARPGTGQMTTCDLQLIAQQKLMAFQQDPRVKEYRVAVSLHAEGDDFSLQGDETKLASVVWNLLTNARQAVLQVEQRELNLSLRASTEYIELQIADSGPGVPAAVQAHIFEPFYTTKGEGTGLGLALVAQIVSMHQGEIYLAAEEKPGATFVVRLPRNQQKTAHDGSHAPVTKLH